ncbi:hypothetical protein ACWD1Y_11675 [Streptomyces sp. NPDC002814]
MTALFGFLAVQGEAIVGGTKFGCRQAVHGSWPLLPTMWRAVVRRVKLMLCEAGAICAPCAGLSTGPCAIPSSPCSPVLLTIDTESGVFPLTEDLLYAYSALDRLRLIATTDPVRLGSPGQRYYVQREVDAVTWMRTEPAERHKAMQEVVDELALSVPADTIRTLLWDGRQEMPYAHNWARATADQGR